jgi:solute carrier family 35, member F1/2
MWPRLPPGAARTARTLAVGQAVSLLLAGSGVFSGLLAARGVAIPSAQSALNYWLLALVYGGYRVVGAYRRRHKAGTAGGGDGAARRAVAAVAAGLAPSVPWWRYALLAAADVEANYLLVEAYEYTSVTSIMLIDCWSIVVAMGLSAALLRRRFGWRHGAGVALCVGGLAVLAASDAGVGTGDGGGGGGGGSGAVNATLAAVAAAVSPSAPRPRPRSLLASLLRLPQARRPRRIVGDADGGLANPLLGDALVLGASSLFAASNVGEEALLHASGGGSTADRTEFLAQLGGWGACLISLQLLALERHELGALFSGGGGGGDPATPPGGEVAALLLGFAACQFGTYSLTAVFLSHCDATLFNLSLLTSDAWAVLASLVLFGQPIRPLYWPALALIVCGLTAYNTGGAPGSPGGAGGRARLEEEDQGDDNDGGGSSSEDEAAAEGQLLLLPPSSGGVGSGWPAKSGPTRGGAVAAAATAAAPASYGTLGA